jgi:hypothetical protein
MPKSPPKSAKVQMSKQTNQRVAEALSDILELIGITNGYATDVKQADAARGKIKRLKDTLTPKTRAKSKKR